MPQPNIQNMLKQAQEVMAAQQEAQEALKEQKVESSAGGGMVKVVVSGDLRLESLTIDPDAVDPEDVEMLQDLVLAATNEALRQAVDLQEKAMNGKRPDLVEPILPPDGALFVQKVRHSAFYSSALDYLLRHHEVETIILAGQVTEQCILYSALDGYIRHFNVRVPSDAVIPIDPELGDAALWMMESNMRAKVAPAAEILDD